MTPYYVPHSAPQPPLAPPLPDNHSSPYSHHHHHSFLPSHLSHLEQPLPPAPPPVPLHFNIPPQPPLAPHPPSHPHASPRGDDVRTLFIAGLPEDVKPREIYHLFREFPGYLSSNLRTPSKNSLPFAFAVFADQQSAITARHALNGMVFDLEKGSTLYIDLAKSNSRSKRQRAGDEGPGSDKKRKVSPGVPGDGVESGLGSLHIPGMDSSPYNLVGYPPSQSHLSYDSRGNFEANAAQSINGSASTVCRDNPPCPTIFVANLGPKSSEKELNQVFSRCRGFLKLKTQSTYGAPVAFVDFKDTACSTEALTQLQGAVLDSCPGGGGMRLEYPF